jgi:hypothetical protein
LLIKTKGLTVRYVFLFIKEEAELGEEVIRQNFTILMVQSILIEQHMRLKLLLPNIEY